MLKQIPKSDITLRPFKVYKNFPATGSIVSGSMQITPGYNATLAYNHTGSFDVLTDSQSLENKFEMNESSIAH
jgi:hypothetical protein